MIKLTRTMKVRQIGLLSLLLPLIYTQNSYAAKCDGVITLFDWQCSSASNGILALVATFLNWMAAGVAAAVLIGIVYGAIIYATAAGDESKAKHGIEIIRNAVIALVLYALMWSFLQFLIPGGLFSVSP